MQNSDENIDPRSDESAYPLEESESLEPLVHEVCPQCGGTRRTAQGLCLRCGEVKVEAEDVEPSDDEVSDEASSDDDEAEEDLVTPKQTDRWLPQVMLGAALLTLAAGIVSGAAGLFPLHDGEGPIRWFDRLMELVRLPATIIGWMLCGLGACALVAWLEDRKVGSWRSAALRLAAAVAVARLAHFIDLEWKGAAFVLELAAQILLFAVMVLLLFRWSPIACGRLTLLTLMNGAGAAVLGQLVVWMLR